MTIVNIRTDFVPLAVVTSTEGNPEGGILQLQKHPYQVHEKHDRGFDDGTAKTADEQCTQ
jgi:hypothetical protein